MPHPNGIAGGTSGQAGGLRKEVASASPSPGRLILNGTTCVSGVAWRHPIRQCPISRSSLRACKSASARPNCRRPAGRSNWCSGRMPAIGRSVREAIAAELPKGAERLAKRRLGDRLEKAPSWRTHSCVPRRVSLDPLRAGQRAHARVPTLHAGLRAWSFYIFNPRLRLDAEFFASGQSCACAVRSPVRGTRK